MSYTKQAFGLMQAAHRFPAIANAVSVAIFSVLAGAPTRSVALITVSMLLAHAAIGSTNDVIDLDDDRRTQPEKPIVKGIVSVNAVKLAAMVEAAAALVFALAVNVPSFLVMLAILLSGMGYNFWAKRTLFSWLPFAIAIPSVVTAGFFSAQIFEPKLWLVYPVGALAAIALNVANSLPDVEGDIANDIRSLTTVLGLTGSYLLIWAALLLTIALLATIHVQIGAQSKTFVTLLSLATLSVVAMIVLAWQDRSVTARRANWYLTAVCTGLVGAAFIGDLHYML